MSPERLAPPELTLPPLREREVHLWLADLTDLPSPPPGWADALSSEERERAARFRFPRHARRFRLAHGLLRQILAAYAQTPPERLAFAAGPYGKPRLACLPAGVPDIRFNLAHSEEMVLLGVTTGGEVGVDIEALDEGPDVMGIAHRFFHREEIRRLEAAPPDSRSELFYTFWTRKEACLKAVGTGLFADIRTLDVSTPSPLPRPAEGRFSPPSAVEDLPPVPGFKAAAALAQGRGVFRPFAWNHTEAATAWVNPWANAK